MLRKLSGVAVVGACVLGMAMPSHAAAPTRRAVLKNVVTKKAMGKAVMTGPGPKGWVKSSIRVWAGRLAEGTYTYVIRYEDVKTSVGTTSGGDSVCTFEVNEATNSAAVGCEGKARTINLEGKLGRKNKAQLYSSVGGGTLVMSGQLLLP